ncbi:MAG: hypothetical protein FJ271_31785 [Planctomycetes bacterium]|nr:hypothetical protein [Planctomycetota bacterium]
MADFMFATASNGPRLRDARTVQAIIGRHYFDWELEVGVEYDPTDDQQHLTIFGYGWPGAWEKPIGPLPKDWEPDFDGDGIDGFERFLKEVAAHLAEPLTVQSVGSVKCRFPLSACEWHVTPGAAEIEVNSFRHCDSLQDAEVKSKADMSAGRDIGTFAQDNARVVCLGPSI